VPGENNIPVAQHPNNKSMIVLNFMNVVCAFTIVSPNLQTADDNRLTEAVS
jgi:hypothetical protein